MHTHPIAYINKKKPAYRLDLLVVLLMVLCLCTVFISNARAISLTKSDTPIFGYVAIIIDDMGYQARQDQRALQLPGQVTYSFLPHAPQLQPMAEMAHARGKEVMLHMPMQSIEPLNLGPGALTEGMSREAFKISLLKSILSVPHVKGINNHMGSLITSQKTQMQWFMEEVARTRLYFVDSRTTTDTLAEQTARQFNIANTRRNIFLDHEPDPQTIELQFGQMIELAKKQGTAVAIGHPYPATLKVLEQKIPQLKAAGIHLVPVSELIHQQYRINQARKQLSLDKRHSLTQNNALMP